MHLPISRKNQFSLLASGLEAAPYELTAAEEKPAIAEPVDVKKLSDWLAKIWLDPDVRKVIDAEDWLKLYESLKDLEQQRSVRDGL